MRTVLSVDHLAHNECRAWMLRSRTRRPRTRWLAAVLLAGALLIVAGCTSSPKSTSAAGQPSSGSASPGAAAQRPNFVFVLTDDLSWNLVSHMPHVQALEKSGTTMSQYYVMDSLCCPSRSAIFTGMYPHDDGVFTNAGNDGGYTAFNAHGDQGKTWAVALHNAGYRTAMMGKYLNQYDPKDPIPPGWDEWDVAGNGYPEFGYNLNEDGRRVHYGSKPQDYLTDVLSGKVASFIDSSAAARKPFMLEVATFAPHAPYTPASRYANTVNLSYPRTPAYDRLPSGAPSWLATRPPLSATDEQNIDTTYDKRVEADLSVDDMIGHLEAELQAKGEARDTYFIFSSDNGYHMGEYRLDPGKQTAFDTDIHVPLIVAGPGVPAGRVAS